MQYQSKYILESLTNYTRYGEEGVREYDPETQFGQLMLSIFKHAFDPRVPFTYKEYPDKLIQNALENGHRLSESRWDYAVDNIEKAIEANDTKTVEQYINAITNSTDRIAVQTKLLSKFKTTEGKLNFIKLVLQAEIPKAKTQEEKDKLKAQIDRINVFMSAKGTSNLLKLHDLMHGVNPFESLSY
jgi:hypothetical protein